MSTIRSKQQNLIRHLLGLPWSRWPVTLGLYPDHLITSAENARKGALMALAGGDCVRARRFLKQGDIEDQFDHVTIEFARLVAEHADLMETLPDPTAGMLPRRVVPGRRPTWGEGRHVAKQS